MEDQSDKQIFRSRISILLIVSVFVAFISVSIPLLQNKAYTDMCVLACLFLLLVFLFTGTRYIISGSTLSLKIGFICGWSVNIADILSVERSYNPVSAPAASLKRLRIDFSKRKKYSYLLISPAREQAFIKALKKSIRIFAFTYPKKRGFGVYKIGIFNFRMHIALPLYVINDRFTAGQSLSWLVV